MKKGLSLLLAVFTFVLSGCYDGIEEITLNEDGSGTIVTTNDMSELMAMARQMAGKELEKMGDQSIDSTYSLASAVDSMEALTAEEKTMAQKGEANIKMNVKEGKYVSSLKFPFKSPSEIIVYKNLSNKIISETAGQALGSDGSPLAGKDMPKASYVDDYFTITYSNGVLAKTLNKEKYATVADDEYLKTMQQSSASGLTLTSTVIINLPRPAKKAEGKNIKLSEDKKKATIRTDIDDFFADPTTLEFRIEY